MTEIETSAAGRPRDPEVDRKIADAAIALFGEQGWAGFSVEAVAKRAGVGKASIYLRWQTKQELLLEALRRHVSAVTEVRASTVRDELIQLASQLMRNYLGDSRRAALRISLEADSIPGVAGHWAGIRESQILAARAIVRRAIERGELPEDTSVTLLLDTLSGAVVNHVQTTPAAARAQLRENADDYVRALVDFLLVRIPAPER
ncbi:TetR/AcrR family transcriptional regulator [Amycolatopsis thermophila]|uniref:AcrR family transcriptional regulator n=1 Tax=Amycolatopsis thermophila TaxID=206084 RepID=A0ABU0F6Z1_9PSEU|nr:TetR/AcrR family transcriptional regulator [Amycolatopsis thermophila]MDQ0382777.1 AcrR family transcriptional regulator [Amycolatopsis thermophila]